MIYQHAFCGIQGMYYLKIRVNPPYPCHPRSISFTQGRRQPVQQYRPYFQ